MRLFLPRTVFLSFLPSSILTYMLFSPCAVWPQSSKTFIVQQVVLSLRMLGDEVKTTAALTSLLFVLTVGWCRWSPAPAGWRLIRIT